MTAVEFHGETFEPREKTNRMRTLYLAKLRPEDFERFMELADKTGSDDAELYEFTGKMIAAVAERPTTQPIDSSDGPSTAPESSVSRLEEVASERFAGRPDMYLAATATA
jgi:hypothetical protein